MLHMIVDPKSQNTESESNPGQNPSQTTRLIGWEHDNPLLIDKVAASLPGSEPLSAPQDSASKPPVQDAGNFPEVPMPDTGSLPGEIDKFLPESYSKLPQSPKEVTEPKEAPNTQIYKQKDLKSSHPKRPVANCQCRVPHYHLRHLMPTRLNPENPTRK
ncbi:hypothetical protein DSO57_1009807 [Entomophthora muscae]|uniref:Uncharacterized protein n=1 Tax=Entomophthora muscae TaxID=34485 RepID=A0ACC2RXS8_9FUNG|nr:hypothetical protein DSO57_1009807 [Entomophthora muscae]